MNQVKVPQKKEVVLMGPISEEHTFIGDNGNINSQVAVRTNRDHFFNSDGERLNGAEVEGIEEGKRVKTQLEPNTLVVANVYWDFSSDRVGCTIPVVKDGEEKRAVVQLNLKQSSKLQDEFKEWNDGQVSEVEQDLEESPLD